MNLHPSIFKTYDVRGIYPTQVDEAGAYAIGRAYATLMLKENGGKSMSIAVGSDARLSSPALKAMLVKGLTESGLSVLDIGLVSTPTYYYAVAAKGYDGGIQVSASHNPKEYNGFKMVRKGGIMIGFDTGLRELKNIIDTQNYAPLVASEKKGTVNVVPSIVESQVGEQGKVLLIKHPIRPMEIIVDTANGMAVMELKALAKRLPQINFVWMNEQLDGSFPAHPADPMRPENVADLCKRIIAEKADFGIATDGDGDRYFFFDETGESIPQEILRGIMAQIILAEDPGAKIVYDIRPGKITPDTILKCGGQPILAPVGHTLIKEVMLKEDAPYGGESSGHHFFKFSYGTFEAPVVFVLNLLQFFSHTSNPISAQVKPYRQYFNTGEINTKLESREKGLAVIEIVKQKYADGEQNLLDGVTVTYPSYSFNLRLGNTEPLLRLIVESKDETVMEQKRDELLKIIKA